jgi:hypothetical protein
MLLAFSERLSDLPHPSDIRWALMFVAFGDFFRVFKQFLRAVSESVTTVRGTD